MGVLILGVDTGYVSTGLALIDWNGTTACLADHTVIVTKPSDAKRRMHKSDDDVRRISEILLGVSSFLRMSRPAIACVESFTLRMIPGSKGKLQFTNVSTATRQFGGYTTAICAIKTAGVALVQMTPQEVRKRLMGTARASKEAVWAAADKWLQVPSPDAQMGEHEWDAAAIALAAAVPVPVDILLALSQVQQQATSNPETDVEGTR